MDTFTLVKRSLAERIDDPLNALLDPETARIGLITTAVQSVVDALTPADGRGRYIVGFQDISTAATSLTDRLVVVSSRPLKDKSLSMIEQAVVVVTFTAHEIGHTHITEPRKFLIGAHNPHTGYHAVANLADDIILEPFMADRFPILRDAFEFTGLWVLRQSAKSLPRTERLRKDMSTAERFNMLLAATRYDTDDIRWAPSAAAERDWALDWKRRLLAARLDDHTTFLALCDEAWDRIRSVADEVDDDEMDEDPEPPVGPTGPGGDEPEPEDDEDADDDEQDPDEDEPDDDEDPEGPPCGPDGPISDPNDDDPDWDDDEQDPDEDEPKGDEPKGDEPKGDEPKGDEPKGDEPKGDEPKGEPKGDDPMPEDHPDADAPTPTNTGKPGGGGNSAANADTAKRSEDDFDPKQVDKSTHDQVEDRAGSWEANDIAQRTRHYASSSITAFGLHGTMATTWE